MNGKTRVIFKHDDRQYGDWKKGDKGFIEGFIYMDRPYIVIINIRTKQLVLVPFDGTVDVIIENEKEI